MESNVIFVKFHTQLQSTDFVVVLVLVVVLYPLGNGLHQLYIFDYENEDDDEYEKQSNRHFRHLPQDLTTGSNDRFK